MRKQPFQKPLYYIFSIFVCLSLLLQTSPLVAFAAQKSTLPDTTTPDLPAANAVVPMNPAVGMLPRVNMANTSQTAKLYTAKSYHIQETSLLATLQPPSPSLDEISLLSDWNLLSLPKEAPDSSPTAVFADIAGQYNAVYAYDGCNSADPWQLFDPAAPPVTNDLTAVTPTIGFWIQATQNTTLSIEGTIPPSTTIQICTGWNLIGMPTEQARPVRNALFSIDGKYSLVFGYDPADAEDPWEIYDVAAPEWANDLQFMQPGRGYWVLATEDATLTISNEGEPPIARLISPDEYATEITSITFITDVIGTAYSNILSHWTLSYRPQGETTWTPFATGYTPVLTGTLDQLDPTLLLNGLYEIQLEVEDYDGIIAFTSAHILVDGSAKLGHFSLTFTDVQVPVAGLPVEVIRMYDSRNKQVGDFGVGWTLALNGVRLEKTVAPGDGWVSTLDVPENPIIPFFSYCLPPSLPHVVTIIFPDDTVYNFRPTISPECQLLVPHTIVDITYEPLPGTYGTLTPLDQSGENLLVVGGNPPPPIDFGDGSPLGPYTPSPNQFWNQDEVDLHDPHLFRLTLPNGRSFVISEENGLQSMTDWSGNILTVTENGISHSNGTGILFQRDEEGRIVQITDPTSNNITYNYDAHGDLVSVLAPNSISTTFTYNEDHYLTSLVDSFGVRAIRNEYDDTGRLIRQIDANGNVSAFEHDLENKQETIIDRLGRQTVYEYDDQGNIIRELDPADGVTQFTYDEAGNKTSETTSLGHVTSFAYDDQGNMTSVADPLGNFQTYTYNSQGVATNSVDRLGNVITHTFDNNTNLISEEDSLGNISTYTYDPRGNQTSYTNPAGCTVQNEYDAFGNLVKTINPLGYATLYTYDEIGNRLTETVTRTLASGATQTLITIYEYRWPNLLTKTTYPDGTITSLDYSYANQVIAEIDELGRRTAYEYDIQGNLIKITYPDQITETYSYNSADQIVSRTDSAGRVLKYRYDEAGRVIKMVLEGSSTLTTTLSTWGYNVAGQIIVETGLNGSISYYGYNANNQQTIITNTLGITQTFSYDALGNLLAATDANGHTTTYEYDANGNNTHINYPDGTSKIMVYNEVGQVIAETDQSGVTTQFEYNCLGHLVRVTNALGQITIYTYDELGNRTSQTDPEGYTTSFGYDERGHLITQTLPLGQVAIMDYDAAGNLISKTDFNGDTTSYTYDSRNRLIQETYPDNETITYTYTPGGQRASVTDVRGTTTYTYNHLDQLLSVVHPDNRVISYAYDTTAQLTSITTPNGVASYTYDALGRLHTVTDHNNEITTYSYDLVGNRAEVIYPNGTITEYSYDSLNRLSGLSNKKANGSIISSYNYTLAPAGNRVQVTEHNGRIVDYTYDNLYQLVGEDITDPINGNKAITYTYDDAGNRLTQTVDGVTTNYNYDANNRLLSAGSTTFFYDANGNVISEVNLDGRNVSYEYDYENQLTQATIIEGLSTTVVDNVYDVDGNRVQTVLNNSNETNYLIDTNRPLAQVLLETDSTGLVQAHYTYGDDLISMQRGGADFYYHYDGQMSTRQLTDSSQVVTDQYTYDAFGVTLAQFGNTTNYYLYTGEQYSPNIGAYYLRARYYQQTIGRFLTTDPIVGNIFDPPTLHKYLYTANNPVNGIDPSGLSTLTINETLGVGAIINALAKAMIVTLQISTVIVAAVAVAQMHCAATQAISVVFGPYGIMIAQRMAAGPACRAHMPIVYVAATVIPVTALHIARAQLGNPATTVLTRKEPPPHDRDWLHQKNKGCQPKNLSIVWEVLLWCDEYPFASTIEGGEGNHPSLQWAPAWEQWIQGGQLGGFYNKCKLNPGATQKREPRYTFGVVVVEKPTASQCR